MFQELKKYFLPRESDHRAPEIKLKDRILIASVVLLLEIGKSDDRLVPAELKTLRAILHGELEIPGDRIDEILSVATEDREVSTDIYEYTRLINEHFSREEKIQMVERFWKIIYADGSFDQFEDYMVHKLARMLLLSHDDLITAKLKMKPDNIKGR